MKEKKNPKKSDIQLKKEKSIAIKEERLKIETEYLILYIYKQRKNK